MRSSQASHRQNKRGVPANPPDECADVIRNNFAITGDVDPEKCRAYLQEMFQGQLDPDVIHMVLTECEYNVDLTLEALFTILGASQQQATSTSAATTSGHVMAPGAGLDTKAPPTDDVTAASLSPSAPTAANTMESTSSFPPRYSSLMSPSGPPFGDDASDNMAANLNQNGSCTGNTPGNESSKDDFPSFLGASAGNNVNSPKNRASWGGQYLPRLQFNAPGTVGNLVREEQQQAHSIPRVHTSYSAAAISNSEQTQFSPRPSTSPRRDRDARVEELNYIRPVLELIRNNERVMILLRGLPGSGKTTLAEQIRAALLVDGIKALIFSTDHYFYDRRGQYKFEASRLSEAHDWNQTRTKRFLESGRSPVIVDNTNVRAWEMRPYIAFGLRFKYKMTILEPNTPWKFSASQLALRNVHGVSKEHIKRQCENYEHDLTVDRLCQRFGFQLPDSLVVSLNSAPFSRSAAETISEQIVREVVPVTNTSDIASYPTDEDSEDHSSSTAIVSVDPKEELSLEDLLQLTQHESESLSSSVDSVSSMQDWDNFTEKDEDFLWAAKQAPGSLSKKSKKAAKAVIADGSASDCKQQLKVVIPSNDKSKKRDSDHYLDEDGYNVLDLEYCRRESIYEEIPDVPPRLSSRDVQSESAVSKGDIATVDDSVPLDSAGDDLLKLSKVFNMADIKRNTLPEKPSDLSGVVAKPPLPQRVRPSSGIYSKASRASPKLGVRAIKRDSNSIWSDVIPDKGGRSPERLCRSLSDSPTTSAKNSDTAAAVLRPLPLSPKNEDATKSVSDNEEDVLSKPLPPCPGSNSSSQESLPDEQPKPQRPRRTTSAQQQQQHEQAVQKEDMRDNNVALDNNHVTLSIEEPPMRSEDGLLIAVGDSENQRMTNDNLDSALNEKASSKQMASVHLSDGEQLPVCVVQPVDKSTCNSASAGKDVEPRAGIVVDVTLNTGESSASSASKSNGDVSVIEQLKMSPGRRKTPLLELENPAVKSVIESNKWTVPVMSTSEASALITSVATGSENSLFSRLPLVHRGSMTEWGDFGVLERVERGEPTLLKVVTARVKEAPPAGQISVRVITRKPNLIDRSTDTSDFPTEAERLDESDRFEVLRQFFPSAAPELLQHAYEQCQGDHEWAVNWLVDSGCELTSFPVLVEKPEADRDFSVPKPEIDGGAHAQREPSAESNISSSNTDNTTSDRQTSSKESSAEPQNIPMRPAVSNGHTLWHDFPEFVPGNFSPPQNGDLSLTNQHSSTSFASSTPTNRSVSSLITSPTPTNQSARSVMTSPLSANQIDADAQEELRRKALAAANGKHSFKITLDIKFAQQLVDTFGTDGMHVSLDALTSDDLSMSVNGKLARTLHFIWMESLKERISQQDRDIEELFNKATAANEAASQRLTEMTGATSVAGPSSTSDQPVSLKEIMDMERAMEESRNDWLKRNKSSGNQHIATKLEELYQRFPGMDKQTLDEIFQLHNCSILQTVSAINQQLGLIDPFKQSEYEKSLMEAIKSDSMFKDNEPELDYREGHEELYRRLQMYGDYDGMRQEASVHFHMRQEAFRKARDCYARGDGNSAAFYSAQAREYSLRMKEANERAARQLFQLRNATHDDNTVDLHGLHIQEAIQTLKSFIRLKRQEAYYFKKKLHLRIITGRGTHSAHNVPRLKFAVENYLRCGQHRYREGQGMFTVTIAHPGLAHT